MRPTCAVLRGLTRTRTELLMLSGGAGLSVRGGFRIHHSAITLLVGYGISLHLLGFTRQGRTLNPRLLAINNSRRNEN